MGLILGTTETDGVLTTTLTGVEASFFFGGGGGSWVGGGPMNERTPVLG